MSTLLRTARPHLTAPPRSVLASARVLLRASLRESSRDRGLWALAGLTPLVVVVLVLVLQGLAAGTVWAVQVGGGSADADDVVVALRSDGDVVETVDGVLAAPGPDVDATVAVTPDEVLVRVAAGSTLAVGELRQDITTALPGRAVRVLGPAGTSTHDAAGYLLPGVVALTSVVLAFPGTAERVARWRRQGTLDLLVGTGGLRGTVGWGLLATVLLPSRMLLALPAVAIAVLGCALTGNLAPHPLGLAGLLVSFVLGSAVCTGLGVLGGFLLRSAGEVRALSWCVVALTVVFGGVLLPLSSVPEAAAAALRWSPASLFADGWRRGLTGASVPAVVLAVAVVITLLALSVVVLVRIRRGPPRHRP